MLVVLLGAGALPLTASPVWGVDDLSGYGLTPVEPPPRSASLMPDALAPPIPLDASARMMLASVFAPMDGPALALATPADAGDDRLGVRAGTGGRAADLLVVTEAGATPSVAAFDALGEDFLPWDVVHAPANPVPYAADLDLASVVMLTVFSMPMR